MTKVRGHRTRRKRRAKQSRRKAKKRLGASRARQPRRIRRSNAPPPKRPEPDIPQPDTQAWAIAAESAAASRRKPAPLATVVEPPSGDARISTEPPKAEVAIAGTGGFAIDSFIRPQPVPVTTGHSTIRQQPATVVQTASPIKPMTARTTAISRQCR
jgi:hypothetical protein